MSDGYTVQSLEASVSTAEYLDTCVDVEKFLGFCRECPSYNSSWSCPTFDFDPVSIWTRYDTLYLYARVLIPEQGTELSALLEAMGEEKAALLDQLLALEQAAPGSMVLSAGSCKLCAEGCTRPVGAPCRKPEKMRHSIESLGGDVGKTAERYLQKPLCWIRDGQVPDYLFLVGGLLTQEGEG